MKQFSKFKQAFVSKQEVPKQDRTDVLSGELQDAERRIDLIKQACESTAKHVKNCLYCPSKDLQSLDKATDKRLKKVPEFLLGTNMIDTFKQIETSDSLKFESVLGQVLYESGGIEQYLGSKLVSYEEAVERNVLLPLQKLVDKDLPNIEKTKRMLTKLTGDMDSQQAKYNQANRHSMSGGTTKINEIKDDLDDTQQKLDQCRDNLAAEMYHMIAREPEISEHFVDFLRAQKEYHFAAYSYLNELLPNVEAVLAKSNHKPVYGKTLEEHLESSNRAIAYPIEVCVCGLVLIGLEEEGLFRIAGSASKVKKLKAAFDAGMLDLNRLLSEYSDPHVIANALKCYLREMPTPLLTFNLHQEWVDAVQVPNPQNKLQSLWTVVDKLRYSYKENYDNLSYLIKFLRELSKQQSVNKMTPANIAIVIAPNLLWAENVDDVSGDLPLGINMTKFTPLYTAIVEQLVSHAEYFFPEEVNFFMTYSRPSDAEMMANGTSDDTGSSSHAESDGMTTCKRSQSSSSLEDQNSSPPHGSPKPVLRRKNKPAPVPPSVKTSGKISDHAAEASSSLPKHSQNLVELSSQRENLPKGLSSARRDMMYPPPPSPSQMNNRKGLIHVTTSSSNSSGGGGGSNETSIPVLTTPKVTPPKPPQPQLNHHKEAAAAAAESNKQQQQQQGDRSKPFSHTYASTLKHKSSFNSGSSGSSVSPDASSFQVGSGSPGHKIAGGQSGGGGGGAGASFYSNSLPRHFHTDNSYKNQRAPRPPSVFSVSPSPVSNPSQSATITTSHQIVNEAQSGDHATQPKKQQQPLETEQQIETASIPTDTSKVEGNNSTISTTTTPIIPTQQPSSAAAVTISSTSNVGQAISTIGFERIEAEVVRQSSESPISKSAELVSKESNTERSENSMEAAKHNPPSAVVHLQESSSSRPVPAPRSSLLQNVNVVGVGGKEKDHVPALKERPTLMAKPRDLAKRTHNSASISAAVTGGGDHISEQEGGGTKDVVNLAGAVDIESNAADGLQRNGLSDKTLPPPSPRAPNRPPRPQPPPPPKLKLESTDL